MLGTGHVEYPLRRKLHRDAAGEGKIYLGNRKDLVAAEIITRVEYGEFPGGGVFGHALPEGGAEGGVGGGGEAGDHGAGVDDCTAGGEGGGGDWEFGAAHGDAGDVEAVEGGAAGDGGERGVLDVGSGGGAEGEAAGGAGGGGEAVREDFTIYGGGLLDEGDGVAAEADEAGGATKEALVVLAATEEEVVDDVGGGHGEPLAAEVANGERTVTVLDAVYACFCGG